jgi:hypothetical protein
VLYGQIELNSSNGEKYEKTIGLGWTVGEEILYNQEETREVYRFENCMSINNSGLL